MNFPDCVTLSEPVAGYLIYEIDHAMCSAKVALHGAQVISWKPRDEEEVLYLSPDAVFREGKAIRGGVPICWPWFNKHPSDSAQPSHGIARTRFWKLEEVTESDSGVVFRFSMSEGIWHAVVTISLGAELEISLETKNPNEIPIVVSGALHNYLAVADVRHVNIVGLDGTDYLDTTSEPVMRHQKGNVIFRSETDAIYESPSSSLLVDDISGRNLLIEKAGSPSTVVWNPWIEKGASLKDLPDEGYENFCCIETAIANEKAVIVMPGSSHVLWTRISVDE